MILKAGQFLTNTKERIIWLNADSFIGVGNFTNCQHISGDLEVSYIVTAMIDSRHAIISLQSPLTGSYHPKATDRVDSVPRKMTAASVNVTKPI